MVSGQAPYHSENCQGKFYISLYMNFKNSFQQQTYWEFI